MKPKLSPLRFVALLIGCTVVLFTLTPIDLIHLFWPEASILAFFYDSAPHEVGEMASTTTLTAAQTELSNQAPDSQGSDSPPVKTDRDKNGDPANKLLASPSWQSWLALPLEYKAKVDPRLIAELRGEILPAHLGGTADSSLLPPADQRALDQTRFIIKLKEQVNLERALSQRVFASSVDQRSAALDILTSTARRSQAALASTLEERLASGDVSGYQSFFIVNAMAAEGNLATIIALALRPDIERIQASYPLVPLWHSGAPSTGTQASAPANPNSGLTEQGSDEVKASSAVADAAAPNQANGPSALNPDNWNIDLVGADEVWQSLSVQGQGAVVAGFDSGVEYTHPALNNNYRGKTGENSYNHNYNWFEPDAKLYPNGNLGVSQSDEPYDCDYYSTHGTHTMGTMVGERTSGSGNSGTDIGMAPKAKWIAIPGICGRTMPDGLADDIGGMKAFQWLLCPTDLTGDLATADCSKAPDVVNNSWGSANPVNDVLHPAIEALRAAGVAPVFAAGNPSAGEGSIGSPGNSPDAITVGATDIDDKIAYFSGRGPSFYAGEQKPELSAPGVDVLSSIYTSYYDRYSGTSMAAPHVAGLVALMVSADLQDGIRDFNVDDIERFMIYSAVDLGPQGADDDYGYGRIDAFKAVSWAQSAGDLRGTIRDAVTGASIQTAHVNGTYNNQNFSTQSGSSGIYSVTVPAGSYDITIEAWGYEAAAFERQSVFANSLSYADFQLTPIVTATLSGVVQTGALWREGAVNGPTSGAPIANAQIMVKENPGLVVTTAADGTYSMTLPSGTHELILQAESHRTSTTTVTIDGAAATLDLTTDAAPKILLVAADAHGGWFTGWPVYPVFEYALNQAGYPYELWRVEYLSVTDTQTNAETGQTESGVPSLATLQQYDLVIWAHSGCGDYYCFVGGSPQGMNAEELLISYLDGGGRLVLSGQNISAWTRTTSKLLEYLGTKHVETSGGTEGSMLNGANFLDDLTVEITNASLYGYRNGLLYLSPDVVEPRKDNAIALPVLEYGTTDVAGAAALAVSPCTANYRSLFFSVGYENLGPRADNRALEAIEVMDRSIEWLAQAKQAYGFSVSPGSAQKATTPGESQLYAITIANTGAQQADIAVNLANTGWATTIYSGTVQADKKLADLSPLNLAEGLTMLPCTSRSFTVEMSVPDSAENGERSNATLEFALDASVNLPEAERTQSVTLTTVAFAKWTIQANMPTARYRLAIKNVPNDTYIYAIGGWDDYIYDSSSANERYNSCTNEWETMSSLPNSAASSSAVVHDGEIYVTGGYRFSYFDYEYEALSDVYIYEPVTDSWRQGNDMGAGLYGHAVASYGDKLYFFGGANVNGEEVDTVYEHDPATGTWLAKAPIPEGKRAYAEAVVLNNKIYLIGGWPNVSTVEVYDPVVNRWSSVAELNFGRQSPGVAVTPDGYIYVAGGGAGWDGTGTVERYNSALDEWEIISSLDNENRVGSGLAYATGRLFLMGGYSTSRTNESLTLDTSFCLSQKKAITPISQPGGTLSYAVSIQGNPTDIAAAQITDYLPISTTFVGFDANPMGAVYNDATRQIEWSGAVPAHSESLRYSYTVALDDLDWANGTALVSQIRFADSEQSAPQPTDDNATSATSSLVFTRTILSSVFIPDFSASSLSAGAPSVIEGEQLTYTVNVMSANAAGGAVAVTSTLPLGMEYVAGSLSAPVGEGSYSANDRTFRWSGVIAPDQNAFLNNSDNFVWYDSDGKNSIGPDPFTASYEWVEISETGERVVGGDDQYICSLDIGFPFTFYGQTETQFCISTNGFISFYPFGYSNYYNECPLPSAYSYGSMIAAMWNDLVVDDVYMQTIGTAPSRALVVQYSGAAPFYYFGSPGDASEFQIILYESGDIKFQYKTVDSEQGAGSTIGVANYTSTLGTTYACNTFESIDSALAVNFTPPGGGLGNAKADVSFAVVIEEGLATNSTISNSVQIGDPFGLYTRTVTTELNPIGLEVTTGVMGSSQVEIGTQIDYQFVIKNVGRFPAKGASLVFPIRKETTFVADSLTCSSGTCTLGNNDVINWNGAVNGGAEVTVTFSAKLTDQLKDSTFLTSIATISDGLGNSYESRVSITARSSDLSNSVTALPSRYTERGRQSVVEIIVRNTGTVQTESRAVINIPVGLAMVEGTLICGTGQCSYADGVITWQGTSFPRSAIPIRFQVDVPAEANYGDSYTFAVTLTDTNRQEVIEMAEALTVARLSYVPVNFSPRSPTVIYMPFAP